MSGTSPKHTKNGRHKACLRGCANSCHREGTENLGGWANLGQTGCPETCSRDSCRGQRLSPADVRTPTSAGGRGPPPRLQTPRAGGAPWPASRDKLQPSSGSYCLFNIRQASAKHLLHVLCTKNTAANATGGHRGNHEAPRGRREAW